MAPIILPRAAEALSPSHLLPRLAAMTTPLAHNLSKRIHTIQHSLPRLARRQQGSGTAVIPSVYKIDGPAPGAVAGIVLGSVAGFILIIILLFFLSGNSPNWTITGENQEIAVVRRADDRSTYGARTRRSRRSDRSERIEIRERERSPRVRTTIVEETRRPSARPQSIVSESRRSSRPPPVIRRVDGDDIVEVIEEGSSIGDMPPRRDQRRRRSSGAYRSVDPGKFAGGGYPQVRVERRGSRGGRYK